MPSPEPLTVTSVVPPRHGYCGGSTLQKRRRRTEVEDDGLGCCRRRPSHHPTADGEAGESFPRTSFLCWAFPSSVVDGSPPDRRNASLMAAGEDNEVVLLVSCLSPYIARVRRMAHAIKGLTGEIQLPSFERGGGGEGGKRASPKLADAIN